MKRSLLIGVLALSAVAMPHDIWIEPSANWVMPDGWIELSLMLGNHGNHHRDFKLASKVSREDRSLIVVTPSGKRIDLASKLVDSNAKDDQDGFWTARLETKEQGTYMAYSLLDKVMSYAPVRDVKCAKTFFTVGDRRGTFQQPVGAGLEVVLMSPPAPLHAGDGIMVRVLYKGKPMPKAKVSFVPKWGIAKGEFDPAFERLTNAQGQVQVPFKEASTYLISTHYKDEKATGKGYEGINYSATLCLVTSRP